MNEDTKIHSRIKIAVVAKYDWYLQDAQNIFAPTNYEVITFQTLEKLKYAINTNSIFDFIFFPHFSEIISSDIYDKHLCIGFHTGDLPSDRGGSPIQNKIMTGDYLTKVSAFRITKDIDGGPIFAQRDINLSDGTIVQILHNLSQICATMMYEIVKVGPVAVEQKGEIQVKVRRKPSDSLLPKECLNTRVIYDHIRMLDGLDYPRAYINWGQCVIELTEAKLDNGKLTATCTFRERS